MNLEELRQQAVRIHDLYDEMNRHERGRVWTREEFMLGFAGYGRARRGDQRSPPEGRGAVMTAGPTSLADVLEEG
ncbi:nucleoside triphosphate pyrophosphohydrolase family protein [Streptomyces daliensis]